LTIVHLKKPPAVGSSPRFLTSRHRPFAPPTMGNNASSIAEEGALLPEPTNKEDEWGACSALLMDSSSFR
jgi:hypothetical protein